jgi:hypothetical protein
MSFNATAQRYYVQFDLLIHHGQLRYFIEAYDNNNNRNQTRFYNITIDDSSPTVISYTQPAPVQYNESPYIYANITDLNIVASVKFKWSLNWATNYTITMSNIGGPTWRTATPLPTQNWNITVYWEINATDNGNFQSIKRFSYLTADLITPKVTNLVFGPTPVPNAPYWVNATLNEPVGASGLKVQRLYYGLSSEGYAYHAVSMGALGGGLWSASIPGQQGVTVRWFLYVEDNAGNNYTSSVHEYTVGGGNAIPFGSLTMTFLGLLLLIIVAYYLTKRTKIKPQRILSSREVWEK